MASAVGVALAGVIAVIALQGTYYDSVLVLAIAYAIVTIGMAVQIGYSNQLAFSQSVFMGMGAYTVAILNTRYGWPVPLALVVAVLGSGVVGAAVGSVVTRAPGLALALATVLFPIPVTTYVTYSTYLGGYTGIGGIEPLWAGDSASSSLIQSGIVAALILGLCVLACGRILRSGVGLELALSSDERTAAALGILTSRRKLELFVLGSMLAALGGSVFAGTQVVVSSDLFSQTTELTLLVMLFVGGRRSLIGAIVGAIGIQYLAGSTTLVNTHLLVIEGVLLTAVLLFEPGGLAQIAVNAAHAFQQRGTSQHPTALDDRGPSVRPTGPPRPDQVVPGPGGRRPEGVAPTLVCQGLSRRFGGLVAVDAVSLEVPRPGLYGICGPNGAGKSTLLELIAGGLRLDAGRVVLEGQDVSHWSAAERAQLGVARTFQMVRLMRHRSVLDNVAVACLPSHRTTMARAIARSDLEQARERAHAALTRVGVAHLAHTDPGRLTLEGQRMVEMARAIAAAPRLLLLDEPASGLSGAQRGRLAELLSGLGEEMAVVVVEHDLELLASIASRLFVLIQGRLRFEGDADDFRRSDLVRTELMGLIGGAAAAGEPG
ncbi:MAG TPA: ATP-binding cassette domain-containing protein [Candidatus Dormibacteraeota bacterium]|nr:ATP-binding cassette domain-containing protein [Candidatus Dormibacteraeota bacterium]